MALSPHTPLSPTPTPEEGGTAGGEGDNQPSFSPYRKWRTGLNVCLYIIVILAVVVMVNYLIRDYFLRLHLSAQTKNPLAPRTVRFLQSLTNWVKVIVYYDKDDPFYSTVVALLNEYKYVNPKISVQTVDYGRDAGAAQQLLANPKYKFLASVTAKNLVIFDCEGKFKAVDGNLLAKYVVEQDPNEKELHFIKRATHFLGEIWFTAALLEVTSPKPLKAYFLKGH